MTKKKKKLKKSANVSGFWKQTTKSTKKNLKKISKVTTPVYSRYAAPTVGLFKQTGKLALNVGKLALRAPGTALTLPLVFSGARHLGKKWGRGYNYSPVRQFDKKGRKII